MNPNDILYFEAIQILRDSGTQAHVELLEDFAEHSHLLELRTHQPEQLLSRKEAAEWLRVSTNTVDRLIRDGHLTTVRIGSRRLVQVESLKELTK